MKVHGKSFCLATYLVTGHYTPLQLSQHIIPKSLTSKPILFKPNNVFFTQQSTSTFPVPICIFINHQILPHLLKSINWRKLITIQMQHMSFIQYPYIFSS
eukprot:858920_1